MCSLALQSCSYGLDCGVSAQQQRFSTSDKRIAKGLQLGLAVIFFLPSSFLSSYAMFSKQLLFAPCMPLSRAFRVLLPFSGLFSSVEPLALFSTMLHESCSCWCDFFMVIPFLYVKIMWRICWAEVSEWVSSSLSPGLTSKGFLLDFWTAGTDKKFGNLTVTIWLEVVCLLVQA